MISKEQYEEALKAQDEAKSLINQYHAEQQEVFERRMQDNPIFTDDELRYSESSLCPCGYGLAYPKSCGMNHHWDCSGILTGRADESVQHTARLPFSMYSIRSESSGKGTTRGVYRPKPSES